MDLSNMYKKEINRQSDEIAFKNRVIITMAIMIIVLMIMVYGFMSRAIELNEENKELRIKIEQLVDENNMIQAKYIQSQRLLNDARVKLLTSYKNATQTILQEIRDIYYIEGIPLTQKEQQYIHRVADMYGLDYKLMIATIDLESNFNQFAVNHNTNGTTDEGYGQINSANKEWLEAKLGRKLDMFNFKDNIDSIGWMMNHYNHENKYLAVTSYNRGLAGARNYYYNYGTYKSQYAKLVLERMDKYE